MNTYTIFAIVMVLAIILIMPKLRARLLLSKAKHCSLAGHVRIAKKVSKLVPFYEFDETRFFSSDKAPQAIAGKRKSGFRRLADEVTKLHPSLRAPEYSLTGISDAQFISRYRVPFQYSNYVRSHLAVGTLFCESSGVLLRDIDGNEYYDLGGSYGVNLLGNDFYKECIDAGIDRVRKLGPVLGPYHPVVVDNVRRLLALSAMDDVSFHMSGTEAVMQAVRLARYHTGRSHVVRFCGAYHGWWDGVQPGIGNPTAVRDVYTLKEMDEATLRVLKTRHNIACVLVNPLQALHPNTNAHADSMLVSSDRSSSFNRAAYTDWLQRLRKVCTQRGIVLILDEIFVGFRIAYRGAQEYFGVQADLVTYGKTLGGGLPIGVVCGKHELMKRFREDRPADICFARGTFNSHPYVMGAMNEFLRRAEQPPIQKLYAGLDDIWDARAQHMNQRFTTEGLPIRVAHLSSIFTVIYQQPSRYNWMLQFYLRAQGLALSWVGTGRLIFSLNYNDTDFAEVTERFVSAAVHMADDGWWWQSSDNSNRSIKRQVLREFISTQFGRSSSNHTRAEA